MNFPFWLLIVMSSTGGPGTITPFQTEEHCAAAKTVVEQKLLEKKDPFNIFVGGNIVNCEKVTK